MSVVEPTEEIIAAPDPGPVVRDPSRRARILYSVAIYAAIATIAVSALLAGLRLRQWAWVQSEPIRYTSDINNAFRQGTLTLRDGYLNRYDNIVTWKLEGDYELDYAPGRLAVATLWAHHVRTVASGPIKDVTLLTEWPVPFYNFARQIEATYTLCRPLLNVNLVAELISATAVFFLVRFWTLDPPSMNRNLSAVTSSSDLPLQQSRYKVRPLLLGLIASLFFWFNPELICNAHCWPQWDCWVLPFFLSALLAASYDCWFVAGASIGLGMMFKGQTLFIAPFFLLWPLFQFKWLAVLRWIVGFAAMVAGATAVWLVRSNGHVDLAAVYWIIGATVALVGLTFILRFPADRYTRIAVAAAATFFIVGPLRAKGATAILVALFTAMLFALLLWRVRRRSIGFCFAAIVAIALLNCPALFNGSMAWLKIGVMYGTRHWLGMDAGPCNNLAAILRETWGWESGDTVFTVPPGHLHQILASLFNIMDSAAPNPAPDQPLPVPLRFVLYAMYALGLIVCSAAAAMQARRKSPRFLLAAATPWLIFFAVMPQMHQRYLLWAACAGSLTVALSPGFALLNLLITAVALSQELMTMMLHRGYDDTFVSKLITGWRPHVGYAVLLAAAVMLYGSLTPEGRQRRREKVPEISLEK